MKRNVFIILLLISSSIFGQDISLTKQFYYVSNDNLELDTICCLEYCIKNESSTSKVIMFTEDDVNRMSLKRLIKSKFYRRYGDFYMSQLVWDNVINYSCYVNIPEFFVKTLPAGKSFDITLMLQNENDCVVDSVFRRHVLVCNLEDIDNKEMFCGFKESVDEQHLEYPYKSITLLWNQFKSFLFPPNDNKEKHRK